jgi:hypothetical protein
MVLLSVMRSVEMNMLKSQCGTCFRNPKLTIRVIRAIRGLLIYLHDS